MSQSEKYSLRRTNRFNAGIPPLRYSPNEENAVAHKRSIRSKSSKSSSSKILKEIELKELEAINKLQEEFEQKKLQFEERKLQRQIAVVRAQASLELEIHENSSDGTKSTHSEINASDGKEQANSMEKTQSVHEKVKTWLLEEEELTQSALGSNSFTTPKEYHPQATNNVTSEVIKEFTTATHAMTQAFKSLADPSKVSFRQVVGKELPLFYGNVEDWPIFISLYRRSTETCKFNNEENMLRLQKALKNEALEAVKSLFVSPENLEDIIQTLEIRFGRPEFIIDSMTNKVKLMPPVNTRYPLSLIKFANSVLNLTVTAQSLKMEAYINNPQLLSQLVQKLPEHLQFQWARMIVDKEKTMPMPTLKEFSEWLQKESSAASLLCKPSTSSFNSSDRHPDRKPKNTVLVGSEETSNRRNCLFCSESGHSLYHCKEFLSLETDGKWEWVKERNICFSCLSPSHRMFGCKNKRRCGIQNCSKYHNRVLHSDSSPKNHSHHSLQVQDDPSTAKAAEERKNESDNSVCFIDEHSFQVRSVTRTVLLRIIPIKIIGTRKSLETFALFDEGSTVTLIDANLAEDIGVQGSYDPLKMYWTNSSSYIDNQSRKVSVKIQGNLDDQIYNLDNVRTVSNLNLPIQSVNVKKFANRWKHLAEVPLVDIREAKPLLLIGQDHIDLTIAREVIQGPSNAPIISKSKLGWVVHGKVSELKHRVDQEFSMYGFSENKNDEDEELKNLIEQAIILDNLGIEKSNKKLLSEEDKKGLQIMENTCRQLENCHREIGLLWKTEEVMLPDSKTTALKRLQTIERKMDRDSQFAERYCQQIEHFVKKGYARVLSSEESATITDRTWYLPHFGVKHPSKPNKFRFVFDAKAEIGGTSLNKNLIRGPDLLNSLTDILFNFRQNRVAVMGDIEEMFLQIRIRAEDQHCQRFLWRGRNRRGPILTYQMQVMIFGAICSPSCAIHVIRQNSNKNNANCPEAARAIEKYHYMDDYLDSFDTEEHAIKVVKEVIAVHMRGGFKMTSWISNSPQVMKHIPIELRSKNIVDLNFDEWPTYERALGLIWTPKEDLLTFSQTFLSRHEDILLKGVIPTKRQVIRVVMSVYDPLGLLAAFTIQARILMQEVWSIKLNWDDKLTPHLFEKWKFWVEALHKIGNIRIPRWYGFGSNIIEIQLHTFNDGSEKGYASVSYFRLKDTRSQISTVLVMAKSRVTSLKPMTIPKIELQAALLGSRLAKTIENGHSFVINKKYFWIDSKVVLSWIKSHPKNYKSFVANRIGEILELSNPDEWHWLPTNLNVADEATRGLWKIDNFENWFNGPHFLKLEREFWPQEEVKIKENTEVEKKTIILVVMDNNTDKKLFDFTRFSNYLRIIRTAAWILRFASILKHKIGLTKFHIISEELTTEEIRNAEFKLIEQAQKESFPEEVNSLKNHKQINKTSRLYKLTPFFDEEKNILKLSGRLDGAEHLDICMRQPIILDSNHEFTRLLIRHYHKANHHLGREQVINHLREKYWIINARLAVKRCVTSCVICQRKNGRVEFQKMGLLPDCRITPQVRAFVITGMDYFGPLTVTIGRRKEKRYGVIFTCMSTRAIHLELASSLTTDSAIMSIRRFICRRGSPIELYSDNGTNLCGAEREMRTALLEIDSTQVQQFCSIRHIQWFKNPPAASHMGGVLERMIRSVKDALRTVLTQQSPREEVLQTLLVEIEYTVNSHPLTYVSSDPKDEGALTPNHFLIGKSNEVTSPGNFSDSDLYLRKQWRIAQRFADQFWKRWLRDFVPTLVKRSKWQYNRNNVSEGDLVIVADGNSSRNTWPRGRIIKTFPGRDNRVRVVDVKTATGVFRRPITKIILLKPA